MFINKETLKVVTDTEVINYYKQYGLSLVEDSLAELEDILEACERPRTESRIVTRTVTDDDGVEKTEEVAEEYTITPEPFPRLFVAADAPDKAVYQDYMVSEDGGVYTVTVAHKPEAEILALRRAAYTREADPIKTAVDNEALYDGVEPDYTLWHAKVAEIKARYPKEAANV